MGASNTKEQKPVWQKVNEQPAYYVDQNGRQAQQNQFVLDNRFSTADEKTIYEQRLNPNFPIVRVFDHSFENTGGALTPSYKYKVYNQRIPHKLTQAPQLTFSESLYVLDRSLQGYEQLYKRAGGFYVNSDLIGFTPEGECKVWMNENFAQNHPSHKQHILQSTIRNPTTLKKQSQSHISNDQSLMLQNILQVVEAKCQNGKFPQDFSSRMYDRNVGFYQARQIIAQYVKANDLFIPNRIDLVTNGVMYSSLRRSIKQSKSADNLWQMVNKNMGGNASGSIIAPQKIATGPMTHMVDTSVYPHRNSMLKFNYIQPNQIDKPNIYASRVQMR